MRLTSIVHIRCCIARTFARVCPFAVRSVSVAALVMSLSGSPVSAGDDVIWPIDYYPYLSSSFGEPRTGRFHYGIDAKSGGVIGKKLFAIGNGWISRVKTTPGGYGKVLYITLENGETAVYGHMSAFLPELEARLADQRARTGSYDVDIWPQRSEFPVTAGQVIGWSGDSGSWGAPHLHLEIRDRDNNPINPMDRGYLVRDTIAPQIRSVVFMPLDNASTVNGRVSPEWLAGDGDGREPLMLNGRIGVAASVWDTADGTSNRMGVYDISLAVDGEIIFSKRYEVLSYDADETGSLDYLDGGFHGGSGTISALFRHPGNKIDFYEGSGVIVIPPRTSPESHTLTITARDHAGNATTTTLPVMLGSRPVFSFCGDDGAGSLRVAGWYDAADLVRVETWYPGGVSWVPGESIPVDGGSCDIALPLPVPPAVRRIVLVAADSTRSMPVDLAFEPEITAASAGKSLAIGTCLRHDRLMVTVTSDEPLASAPVIAVTENGTLTHAMRCTVPDGQDTWTDAVPLTAPGVRRLHLAVTAIDASGNPVSAEAEIDCAVIDSMKGGMVRSDDGAMNIRVPAGALCRNATAMIADVPVKSGGELRALSGGYRFVVGEERLRAAVEVSLGLADGDPGERAALYSSGGDNNWRFVSDVCDGPVMIGTIPAAAMLAVFEDTTPPVVRPASPSNGAVLTNTRPTIKATVSDGGAGLGGSDSIHILLDGKPVYGEYDPVRGTVTWKPVADLAAGDHTIEITVTDQVGNAAIQSWGFVTR